jgi:hypothetical protein
MLTRTLGGKYTDDEVGTLVHALIDIEESCRTILRLSQAMRQSPIAPTSDALVDLLTEFGEELAHIVYHAADARVFRPFLERGLANYDPED